MSDRVKIVTAFLLPWAVVWIVLGVYLVWGTSAMATAIAAVVVGAFSSLISLMVVDIARWRWNR
jgi:hypothetical protein